MKSLEKVLLVIVQIKAQRSNWTADDLALEMEELVNACYGVVVDKVFCRL